MPSRSTSSKPTKKSATAVAKPAKPAVRSKAVAAPKAAAKGRPAASSKKIRAASKPVAPAVPEPQELVRPLIRVRQAREFTTRKVTRAELHAITEAARWSGSSRNEQPCRFIVLRDRTRIRDIAELGLPQTRGLRTATAAVAIVLPDEPGREISRAFDDGRAAERMLIAAHLLGLGGGISFVRRDVRDGINAALGLPAKRSVRTIVAFGHPTEDALQSKSRPGQARLPREEVIFEERWPDEPAQP